MPINLVRAIEAYSLTKRREEAFTPTPSQTVFTIAEAPSDNSDANFRLNGMTYETGVDFSVSGTTVTWIKAITLDSTDLVEIIYYVQ